MKSWIRILGLLAILGVTRAGAMAPPVLQPVTLHEAPLRCAACRLVEAVLPQLPSSSLAFETRSLSNGFALRVSSPDPGVRETLWRATVARGELLTALRGPSAPPLCAACRERLERLQALRILSTRTPDGVLLLYTSLSPDVVRELHVLSSRALVETSPEGLIPPSSFMP
jgi:hypothetical protein